jgi:hypothetical protein
MRVSFVRSPGRYIDALITGAVPSLTATQRRQVLEFAAAAEKSAPLGKRGSTAIRERDCHHAA